MGEFLFWFFVIVAVPGVCIFVWSGHIKEKHIATIDDHIQDLAEARLRLIPTAQFGLVDDRKWKKIKRDFVLGHFELSSRREHALAQEAWMARIDVEIDKYLANKALVAVPTALAESTAIPTPPAGSGIVYILTNPSMPGLVKIGMTTRDVSSRLRELNSATGVPQAFEVIYTVAVVDCAAAERFVHEALHSKRTNQGREFFRVDTSEAIDTLLIARQRHALPS
ncbi:MAG TPA: GIY-YIG nuclease family protein [Telluria sp.]